MTKIQRLCNMKFIMGFLLGCMLVVLLAAGPGVVGAEKVEGDAEDRDVKCQNLEKNVGIENANEKGIVNSMNGILLAEMVSPCEFQGDTG